MTQAPQGRPNAPTARLARLGRLTPAVILLIGLLLAWHSLSDWDIWLHNQAGTDLLAGDGFPSTNTYSFTEPDHPWHNHEWLFQIIVALTGPNPGNEGPGGWNWLRLGLTGVLLLVLLLGEGRARLWAGFRHETGAALIGLPLLGALVLLWPRLTLRPELLSYLFFVFLVRWVEQTVSERRTVSDRRPWWSILDPRHAAGRVFYLLVLWAQIHGFVVLGVAVWILAGLLSLLETSVFSGRTGRVDWRLWLGGLVLSVLALILTPNGLGGLVYPVKALSQFGNTGVDLRQTISELAPLLKTPNALASTILMFQLSLAWGVLWISLTWGRLSLLRMILWALAAWATLASQRSVGFYAIAFFLLHTGVAANGDFWWRRWLKSGLTPWTARISIAVTTGLGVIWAASIIDNSFYLAEGVSRRFGGGLTPAHYPTELVPPLTTLPEPRIVSSVDGAGYLLDRTSVRLFIDGRTEAYSTERWRQYTILKNGGSEAASLLAKIQPDFIALTLGSGAFDKLAGELLVDPLWDLFQVGEASLLFRPAGPGSESSDRAGLANRLQTMEQTVTGAGVRVADRLEALAGLWKLAGRVDGQERLLRRGLELAPDHPTLLHNLGNVLLARSDFGAALPLFERAGTINRRAISSVLNAGVCLVRLNRLPEAEGVFSQVTGLNPDRVEGWANLAGVRAELGDIEGAVVACEKAVALAPGDTHLGNLLLQLKGRR